MSWGATAFTPLISYNAPPFGFAERIQSPDFPTCPENPWIAAEKLKEDLKSYFDTTTNKGKGIESFIDINSHLNGISITKIFLLIGIVLCLVTFSSN